ncbi:MAG: DUF2330 domain-containing protein [Myxococcota bacterium]
MAWQKCLGGLLCAWLALGANSAAAFCGFYVAGADTELYNHATMVVMMREGTRTVLSMQNNYQGPADDFAMVVPVPVVLQEENVKTLERSLFDRVDTLAAPRLVEYWEEDPCLVREEYPSAPMAAAEAEAATAEEPAEPQVVIEAQFAVGEYEVVVLSASDSSGLDDWLRSNHYRIPEGAEPVLRPYVEAGSKFFVAKVDSSKVRFEDGQAMLSPLRFHYDSDDFSLPVRLGLLNSQGAQDLIVHILAQNQRYEAANYENVTIPTNIDVADEVRTRFGEFYAALFDETLAHNPRAVVTEYAWQATNCDPCPGPVLSEADLYSLGADVMPSLAERASIATARFDVRRTTDGLAVYTAQRLIEGTNRAAQMCHQAALGRGTAAPGLYRAELRMVEGRVDGTPEIAFDGRGDAAFRTCLATALSDVRLPPTDDPSTLSLDVHLDSQREDYWEIQFRLQSFVLTRLHARYSRDSLGEDLVFRPASAIVGGREFLGSDGQLETGAEPASQNNFQGRYAIRHPWEGAIACESPVRGRWGGPPTGTARGPSPARDLAFAPRGQLALEEMVREDVPEIDLTLAAAATPVLPPAPRSGCACDVPGGRKGSALLGFVAALFAFTVTRRRLRA